VKLPDALEQAVRALLAPNGSTRNADPAGRGGGAGRSPEQEPVHAELIRRLAEHTAPTVAAEPEREAVEPVAAEPDPAAIVPEPVPQPGAAGLVELERAAAVVERLGLGFHLGSAVERIALAADEGRDGAERLREAAWLIERYLELLERRPVGADLHVTMMRLAREGDTIAGLQAIASALEQVPPPAAELPPGAAEPVAADAPPEPEHVVVLAQPSLGRELLLIAARALVVAAAIVGIVLALTLIAQIS